MLVPTLALLSTAAPSMPSGAMLDIPECLATALSPILGKAVAPATGPYAAQMSAASATAVGGLGDYLKCIRIVNGTERVANYAMAQ